MERQEFIGKWENKGVTFEMIRKWGEEIADHLEMFTSKAGEEKRLFATTTRYIDIMDFLLYCQYNYEY